MAGVDDKTTEGGGGGGGGHLRSNWMTCAADTRSRGGTAKRPAGESGDTVTPAAGLLKTMTIITREPFTTRRGKTDFIMFIVIVYVRGRLLLSKVCASRVINLTSVIIAAAATVEYVCV